MKTIKELIRFFGMIGLIYSSPLLIDKAEDIYFKGYIGSKVVPLTRGTQRYCSASNIEYEGKVYLITNRHCCARGKGFATALISSFNQRHKVLYVSQEHDVCVASSTLSSGLKIDTKYNVGDAVKLIGYPRGMRQTVRKGDIFDISYSVFPWLPESIYYKYLHITSTSYPGNSGSPVVDRLGRVIGLLFAGNRLYSTEGIVVPSEFIIKAIKKVK